MYFIFYKFIMLAWLFLDFPSYSEYYVCFCPLNNYSLMFCASSEKTSLVLFKRKPTFLKLNKLYGFKKLKIIYLSNLFTLKHNLCRKCYMIVGSIKLSCIVIFIA